MTRDTESQCCGKTQREKVGRKVGGGSGWGTHVYLGLIPTDIWQKTSQYYTYPPVKINKSVQFSSVAQSCPTHCDPMDRSTPGLPVHHMSLPKPMSIESVMPSSHLILCHPLLHLSPRCYNFQSPTREITQMIINRRDTQNVVYSNSVILLRNKKELP